MKDGPDKGKVCGKPHISKLHFERPPEKGNSTSSKKKEDGENKDWLDKSETDSTATGARLQGPDTPDSRNTETCTNNNDTTAVNKYEASETVEAVNALNCTLTNSIEYLDDRDVRPLFLSHDTLKSHFACFRRGERDDWVHLISTKTGIYQGP